MKKPALNPVFLKELRQLVRSRAIIWMMLLYPIALFVVCALVIASNRSAKSAAELALSTGYGTGTCVATAIILGLVICVMLPVYSSIKMTLETVKNRMGLEFITGLSPRQIVTGKMSATALLMLVTLTVSLPFFILSYLLRGITLGVVLLVPTILFAGGLATLSLGTLIASQRRPVSLRITEIVIVLLLGPGIYFCTSMVLLVITSLGGGHSSAVPTTSDILETLTIIALGLFSLVLICRAVSASMLSPPFVDAIRPVRTTELVLFLLTTTVWFFDIRPWCLAWTAVAAIIGVRATTFPLALPRSVAVNAPRSFVGRLLSFPLTGAYAPGLLFSFLLAGVASLPGVLSGDDSIWMTPLLYLFVVPVFAIPSLFSLRSDTKKAHHIAFVITLGVFVILQFTPLLHAWGILSEQASRSCYGAIPLLISDNLNSTGATLAFVAGVLLLLIIITTTAYTFGKYRRR